ncbi:PREDICTED: E3 ubiquitin-protein ligase RNF138-like [Diuraphis noxia]|uniref:E3 ubiquitin-protein ligase RNF138-like n=1 Tax=Diuraphis noxia TaxID=143948 RepID=UPI00076381F8|nr:PREDICTED: E3 ubiquitin-protein ligase RNF138-like [Diuraphis noxia]
MTYDGDLDYHKGNRRQRSNAAEAWTWFYAEDLNRVVVDETQELGETQHRNEEIFEVCVICHQGLSNVTTIPCQHVFCRRCIIRWMDEGNTGCPLCRAHINRLQN